jgi:tetratricopeptide (TPR) repeat protein
LLRRFAPRNDNCIMEKIRKYFYIGFGVLTVALVAILIVARNTEKPIPQLKERNQYISNATEWLNTKAAINGLLAKLRQNPKDEKAKLQLAQAYIQESRVTGDHAYYDKAALQLLNDVLKDQPENYDAVCCMATVYLSQHHFADALPIGEKAIKINPYNAFGYGLLVDANVELGNYTEAVKMADKMVSVRPDGRSYARISYLREIYGDLNGAINAMKMAVDAGYPGLEQTEWCRVQLGKLYEMSGNLAFADMQYEKANYLRPNYAYALAGMGRIKKANKDYPAAIDMFQKAAEMLRDYSFSDELTDLYKLNNEPTKAAKQAAEVVKMLTAETDKANSDQQIGHYADRELAYAYLKVNDYDNALKHALIEYNRRTNNIDVNRTLARVYYKRGEIADARKYIAVAMKTKSNNPELLYEAGLIYIKSGELMEGLALIKKSLDTNPFLDTELKNEGAGYLAMK